MNKCRVVFLLLFVLPIIGPFGAVIDLVFNQVCKVKLLYMAVLGSWSIGIIFSIWLIGFREATSALALWLIAPIGLFFFTNAIATQSFGFDIIHILALLLLTLTPVYSGWRYLSHGDNFSRVWNANFFAQALLGGTVFFKQMMALILS